MVYDGARRLLAGLAGRETSRTLGIAMVFRGRRRLPARLADAWRLGRNGWIPPPCVLAHPLQVTPVDDLDELDAVDLVGAHQPLRRQLVDHRAHGIVVDRVAGQNLHPDRAGPQRLHAEIVGKVPQANEQETRHRLAVDDGLPGPEVGGDFAITGHRADSSWIDWRRCTARTHPLLFPPLRLSDSLSRCLCP
jgi:hypothetical protein